MVLDQIKCFRHFKSTDLHWRHFGLGISSFIGLAVGHKAWFGNKLGWTCPFRHWTGVPCPAWGMTRSFMAMAQGDLSAAFHFHGFGPILFILLGVSMFQLGWECLTNRPLHLFYSPWLRLPVFWVGLLVIYISYHLVRLKALAESGDLYASFFQSPLAHLIIHN
jgi:Protein of unknown function (DUF2752)